MEPDRDRTDTIGDDIGEDNDTIGEQQRLEAPLFRSWGDGETAIEGTKLLHVGRGL